MLDHISVDVPLTNNHISIIISKPIYSTATFGFLNAYKIIYVLDYLCSLLRYYHRRNYGQTYYTGKKKPLKKTSNEIGTTIEPCGTPDFIVLRITVCLINFYTLIPIFQV